MARDQPTADVAARDYPISVLGRRRMSNVELLSTLLVSGGIRCVRSSHVAPPYCSDVQTRSTRPLVTNDVVRSIHLSTPDAINEQCG
jgi:hypothetical protein